MLEYYERDFVEKSLAEAYRILKPNAKFVLDVPDNENPIRRIMNLIKEYMGRPDKFDISPLEFENILEKYFEVEKKVSLSIHFRSIPFCIGTKVLSSYNK